MAATLEIKYFNSYWLKKIKSIQPVGPNSVALAQYDFVTGNSFFTTNTVPSYIGAGQKLSYTYASITYNFIILGWGTDGSGGFKVYLDNPITSPSFNQATIPAVPISFGNITDFNYIPGATQYVADPTDNAEDWYIEESRIRGGYNNVSTDLGVRAYVVEDTPNRQNRVSSLIYSGIFNSRTGINNTNQFSVAEDITKSMDPSQGSIQKLYAEDTNLIIFQELKVTRALIDKTAVYSAEGEPLTTSANTVIGQMQGYAGNYGIGTNPESFAVYGYRKYFVDRNQNVVLRLSQDGITEISAYGMTDFFRDNLSLVDNNGKIVGGWDIHNKQYVVSLQPSNTLDYKTLSFDEDVNGWTSLFSFNPDFSASLLNNYYTFKEGVIWKHYADPIIDSIPYANFYGVQYNSTVTFVFNPNVSLNKNFNTLNYEGTIGWQLVDLYSDSDTALPISTATEAFNLNDLQNQLFLNNFKRKENKFFGTIINNSGADYGEIVYGQSMSGIKGFYTTAKMVFTNPPEYSYIPTRGQLFSVSAEYVESSY